LLGVNPNRIRGVDYLVQFVGRHLAPSGKTLAVEGALARIAFRQPVRGTFRERRGRFQDSLNSQPWLILAALITSISLLGVLYESYVHPITILSTLPPAGVGALLALLLFSKGIQRHRLIGVIPSSAS